MLKTMAFWAKLPRHCVSEIMRRGYETFKNIKPALQNHITKMV